MVLLVWLFIHPFQSNALPQVQNSLESKHKPTTHARYLVSLSMSGFKICSWAHTRDTTTDSTVLVLVVCQMKI